MQAEPGCGDLTGGANWARETVGWYHGETVAADRLHPVGRTILVDEATTNSPVPYLETPSLCHQFT